MGTRNSRTQTDAQVTTNGEGNLPTNQQGTNKMNNIKLSSAQSKMLQQIKGEVKGNNVIYCPVCKSWVVQCRSNGEAVARKLIELGILELVSNKYGMHVKLANN
jgi:hypothetical protein